MDKLPTIISFDICLNLPFTSLYNIFLTNKKFSLIGKSNYFWYCKFFKVFKQYKNIMNLLSLNDLNYDESNWKMYYKSFYEQVNLTMSHLNIEFSFLHKNLYMIDSYICTGGCLMKEMKNWFLQLFPNPQVYDYMFNYIALCLLRKPIHSIPILYGDGNNGKSLFIAFIMKFFSSFKIPFNYFFVCDESDISSLVNSIIDNRVGCIGETYLKLNIDNPCLIKVIEIKTVYGKDYPIDDFFGNRISHFDKVFPIFMMPFCLNMRINNNIEVPSIIDDMTYKFTV